MKCKFYDSKLCINECEIIEDCKLGEILRCTLACDVECKQGKKCPYDDKLLNM